MIVEIRIYKRYDLDLIALHDAGLPLNSMMKNALIAYANAAPLKYLIDEIIPFDLNNKTTIHIRLNIPDVEEKAIYMIKHIKHGLRNVFCKMVLRNALVQQNLNGFFSDNNLSILQKKNLDVLNTGNNTIPCSALKITRTVSFAGKTIVKEPVKPIKANINPFKNMEISNTTIDAVDKLIATKYNKGIENVNNDLKNIESDDEEIDDFLTAFDSM